ncbi:hypothetical protein Vretimale_20127 [Volvox reticuliferus]|uniref:Uncharacterized protein n=1 Tax=Volvox reticuliferus TaxID=1737510 RepID=A0A8J4H1Z1_9CHLO|nr:hypothetical protein Vretimale_20127 [Volvox reticuliferus]
MNPLAALAGAPGMNPLGPLPPFLGPMPGMNLNMPHPAGMNPLGGGGGPPGGGMGQLPGGLPDLAGALSALSASGFGGSGGGDAGAAANGSQPPQQQMLQPQGSGLQQQSSGGAMPQGPGQLPQGAPPPGGLQHPHAGLGSRQYSRRNKGWAILSRRRHHSIHPGALATSTHLVDRQALVGRLRLRTRIHMFLQVLVPAAWLQRALVLQDRLQPWGHHHLIPQVSTSWRQHWPTTLIRRQCCWRTPLRV